MNNMKIINITITHPNQMYPIFIGSGLLEKLDTIVELKKYSSIYVISDTHVSKYYLPIIQKILKKICRNNHLFTFVFEAGEKSKQLYIVEQILKDMAAKQLDRSAVVINLGGGVVSDLGGFAASIFQRGVDFINISTTLEGMVDASVGGKTGVNLGNLKNYIGTFHQPKAVIIDVNTLKTVPKKALLQGYAEVVKHGLIRDKHYFETSTQKSPLEMNAIERIGIIVRSIQIKSQIVSEDEKEKGVRKLLNFGHTVGHALESLSLLTNTPLFHGEAVAIGMIAEAKISERLGMIDEDAFEKIEKGIQKVGLPIRAKDFVSMEKIITLLLADKKNVKGKIKWTLLTGIGSADFNIEIAEPYVRKAIAYILQP